jgi:hypothetical protein
MGLFPIIQVIYWVSLATWFGGVLFVAMAAPIIFRTVRQYKPMLPTVLSVNLENQHADLLAGTIVGNILAMLSRVQLACAAGVLVGLAGQWWVFAKGSAEPRVMIVLRTCAFLAATIFLIYDWRVLGPRIRRFRDEFIEHADEPDIANPAKEQFDRYHRESVNVLSFTLGVLLLLVFLSAGITTAFTVTYK